MKITASLIARFGICALMVIIPTIVAMAFGQMSIGFMIGSGFAIGGGAGFEMGEMSATGKFDWWSLLADVVGSVAGIALGFLMIIKL